MNWDDPTKAAATALYDGAAGAALAVAPQGFASGTGIATPCGGVPIQDLRPGDAVLTQSGRPARVVRSTSRVLAAEALAHTPDARGIWFRASALGHLRPQQALLLAPGQMVLADRVAAPAAALVNGISISRRAGFAPVTYVRLSLDAPEAIFASGLAGGTGAASAAAAVVRLRMALAALAGLCHGPLDGNIATLDHGSAAGWVIDRDHPDLPVALEIVAGGTVVALALADRRRPDLEMAGIGSGRCGFAMRLNRHLPTDRDHLVQIRRADDGVDMPGSPLLLPRAHGDGLGLTAALEAQAGDVATAAERDEVAAFLAERMDALLQVRLGK